MLVQRVAAAEDDGVRLGAAGWLRDALVTAGCSRADRVSVHTLADVCEGLAAAVVEGASPGEVTGRLVLTVTTLGLAAPER
jgi:hypothetical protein